MIIKPQAGPQTMFNKSKADIAFYGGAAGGGKSFALLLEWLYHYHNPRFGAVTFRRNSTQVKNQGGLWDESEKLYKPIGGYPREASLQWTFPSGMEVKFGHLEYEKTKYDWQGAQIAGLGFDELTHFTISQFFYMLSRNRSMSGVPGYVRATCNPDADSWVRNVIDWWIGDDGFPIHERSGVLRWFIRRENLLLWADSAEELIKIHGPDERPKSLTFIPAKLTDNPILMESDPSYLANLKALDPVERGRLLGGNWNIRASGGTMFRSEWFPVVDAIPAGWMRCMRFWDRAATKPTTENMDPDWTRGLKLYKYADGTFIVADLKSAQDTPGQVERLILATASQDSKATEIMSQQDPGSAGVAERDNFIKMLQGYIVDTMVTSKDKVTRAKPVSAQAEAGNIKILRASWNDVFIKELEAFPDGAHDDIVDVLSGCFNMLAGGLSIIDAYRKR